MVLCPYFCLVLYAAEEKWSHIQLQGERENILLQQVPFTFPTKYSDLNNRLTSLIQKIATVDEMIRFHVKRPFRIYFKDDEEHNKSIFGCQLKTVQRFSFFLFLSFFFLYIS